MAVSIKASVRMGQDNIGQVVARVSGLTEKQMAKFAIDIRDKARENASSLDFADGTGTLASGIELVAMGPKQYRIQTTSGHASYIELGTQYIKGKMPFLWPAYRWAKKKFFSRQPWL